MGNGSGKGFSVQEGVRVVRKVDAVRISGATGVHAASVNGVYHPVTGEACGGRPVYKKEGSDSWIEYLSQTEQWQVKSGADRGKDMCRMASAGAETQSGVLEEVTVGWVVSNGVGKGFSAQAGVRVVRKADAVRISGATGKHAASVNGGVPSGGGRGVRGQAGVQEGGRGRLDRVLVRDEKMGGEE